MWCKIIFFLCLAPLAIVISFPIKLDTSQLTSQELKSKEHFNLLTFKFNFSVIVFISIPCYCANSEPFDSFRVH